MCCAIHESGGQLCMTIWHAFASANFSRSLKQINVALRHHYSFHKIPGQPQSYPEWKCHRVGTAFQPWMSKLLPTSWPEPGSHICKGMIGVRGAGVSFNSFCQKHPLSSLVLRFLRPSSPETLAPTPGRKDRLHALCTERYV
jgi:hypothetical protein